MPARTLPRLARGLILCAALVPLSAQETGFNKELKIRVGLGLSTQDNLRPASQGLGLDLGWTAPYGRIGVELGYFYKTGNEYVEPIGTKAPGSLYATDLALSGDARRNQLDGFALRLSFRKNLNADWAWSASLMLGGTKFKHEVVGDVRSEHWDPWDGSDEHSWRDTYSHPFTEGGMKLSPFASLRYKVGPSSSLECTVLALNYTSVQFTHNPGSGTYDVDHRLSAHNGFPKDGLTKHNRLVPHVEFAYVFHF